MPIYEYECAVCGHRFEVLIRPSQGEVDELAACPSCHGINVHKVLSLFAVNSEAVRQRHFKQARESAKKELCDKQHAEMEASLHHDD